MRVEVETLGAMDRASLPQTLAQNDVWASQRELLLIALLLGTTEESPASCLSSLPYVLPEIMPAQFAKPVSVDGPGNTIS